MVEKFRGGAGKTRAACALTHRAIEAFRPEDEPYRVPDARCRGLVIRVAPNGGLTWDLAYRVKGAGRVRRLSLGRFPEIGLDAARNRANELTRAARAGHDLIANEIQASGEAASRVTIGTLIEIYIRRRVIGRLRTASEIERRLKRALVSVLNRPADEMQRRHIRVLLDEVADRGTRREAEKRRQTIGAMFRWALSQDLVETDPTAGLKGYDTGTPRDRVLSADEIQKLWLWLEEGALPTDTADILRIQIATGARCGEVSGIHAEEIDCAKWLWTLPAERSKNKRPRVTPLVGAARKIIGARLASTNHGPLFITENGKPQTSMHVGQTLFTRRARFPIGIFTTHDLRRTFATMLAESGVPLDLVAAIVGHEPGGRNTRTLVRHYVRTDQIERKAAVLEEWDRRLAEIVQGTVIEGNVVQFGSAMPPPPPAKRSNPS